MNRDIVYDDDDVIVGIALLWCTVVVLVLFLYENDGDLTNIRKVVAEHVFND
jgi:hypothetical protein